MKARLVRRSIWLVTTALFAAPAVAWSQAPPAAGPRTIAAASSEAQSTVKHVLLLQSFDRGNMTDDYTTANLRVDLGQRIGQAVNVVEVVGSPTFGKISRTRLPTGEAGSSRQI